MIPRPRCPRYRWPPIPVPILILALATPAAAVMLSAGCASTTSMGPDRPQADTEAGGDDADDADKAAEGEEAPDAAALPGDAEDEDPRRAYARLVEEMAHQLPADSAGLVEPTPRDADARPASDAPPDQQRPTRPVSWPGVRTARLLDTSAGDDPPDATSADADEDPALDWDDLVAGMDRQMLLGLLLQRLDREADDPMERALAAAALGVVDGDLQLDPAVMSQLSRDQRRQVMQYRQWLVQLGGRIAAASGPLEREQLEQMVAEAAGREAVRINTVQLCRRVRGFGVYETLDPQRLTAMQPNGVVIYTEVDRFESTPRGEHYEVELVQSIALYADAGGERPVWSVPDSRIRDRSRNRRRDFFTVQPVRLPPLPVGRYALKVRIIDQADGSSDVHTIPLRIADPKDPSRTDDDVTATSTPWPR